MLLLSLLACILSVLSGFLLLSVSLIQPMTNGRTVAETGGSTLLIPFFYYYYYFVQ